MIFECLHFFLNYYFYLYIQHWKTERKKILVLQILTVAEQSLLSSAAKFLLQICQYFSKSAWWCILIRKYLFNETLYVSYSIHLATPCIHLLTDLSKRIYKVIYSNIFNTSVSVVMVNWHTKHFLTSRKALYPLS